MGSPLFMAPENLMNLPYDTKSDIYSLGCLLYNLLTAKYPHFCTSDVETLKKQINNEEVEYPKNRMTK